VISARDVSPGEKNEGHLLMPLMDQYEANTGEKVTTAVADSKYGIKENYLACSDRGVRPHFESFDKNSTNTGTRKGIFKPSDFVYNPHEDCFICPGREVMERRKFKKKRNHFEYSLPASLCNACPLKPQCTRSKQGRTVKRHIRQDDLGRLMAASQGRASRKDIKKRQYLMERTFAQGFGYSYQRFRWRRLWRVKIQEYLIAAIQNILVLVRNSPWPDRCCRQDQVGWKKRSHMRLLEDLCQKKRRCIGYRTRIIGKIIPLLKLKMITGLFSPI
jgi:hypothetical protein